MGSLGSGYRLILFFDYTPYQSERRHWKRETRVQVETMMRAFQKLGVSYHSIYQKMEADNDMFCSLDQIYADYQFKANDMASGRVIVLCASVSLDYPYFH